MESTPAGLPEVRNPLGERRSACAASAILQGEQEPVLSGIDRRCSCGLPIVVVQHPAEARATGDLAICPTVIRRTDVPDELATDALVKPLGHAVPDEFLDQVAPMSLAEDDEVIETLALDGSYKALRVRIAMWAPE